MPLYESDSDRFYELRALNYINELEFDCGPFTFVQNPPRYFADWSMVERGTSGNRPVRGLPEYKKRSVSSEASFIKMDGVMIPADKLLAIWMMCSKVDIPLRYYVEFKDGLFMYEETNFVDFNCNELIIPSDKILKRRNDPNDQNLTMLIDLDYFHKLIDIDELELYAPNEKNIGEDEQDGSKVRRTS